MQAGPHRYNSIHANDRPPHWVPTKLGDISGPLCSASERTISDFTPFSWRYLTVAIQYLYSHRQQWNADAAIGTTLVSSSMIDLVAGSIGRRRIDHREKLSKAPALQRGPEMSPSLVGTQ
jgi:hypothetical protein